MGQSVNYTGIISFLLSRTANEIDLEAYRVSD
jgi:hypothetical protein